MKDLKKLITEDKKVEKKEPYGESYFGRQIETLKELIEKQEFKTFLSGKYDKNNALLEIFSGAGGQDSQDWATMLLKMYERYCGAQGFKTIILHQAFGEAGGPEGRIGTKSVTMEIKGKYAYGFLKKRIWGAQISEDFTI